MRIRPADRLDQDLEIARDHGIRIIANTVTFQSWRNGPVENIHAGMNSGYGLEELRVLPKAENAIIRQAQGGLLAGLKAVDYLRYDNSWPPLAERVLPFLHGLVGPTRWTVTETSRAVALPLRRDDQGGNYDRAPRRDRPQWITPERQGSICWTVGPKVAATKNDSGGGYSRQLG